MRVVVANGFPGNVLDTHRIAVANSVARVVHELIPGDPPMGRRSIELYHGKPQVLWTTSDYHAPAYRINIDSEGSHFQQFAYQLGHELGHVKFGPARSNHLLEVFAEMVSLATMKRLGRIWQERAPYMDTNIDWTKLARTHAYVTQLAESAARTLPASIREGFINAGAEERIDRLAAIRPQVDNRPIDDKVCRAYQQASAHLILSAKQHRWKDLLGIGMQATPPPSECPEYTASLPILPAAIPEWIPRHLR